MIRGFCKMGCLLQKDRCFPVDLADIDRDALMEALLSSAAIT
jgi:hypothetical protein